MTVFLGIVDPELSSILEFNRAGTLNLQEEGVDRIDPADFKFSAFQAFVRVNFASREIGNDGLSHESTAKFALLFQPGVEGGEVD